MKPLVSVIIPHYNRIDFLKRAVNSVCQQSFTDWELIIVDDGSMPELQTELDLIAQLDTRLRLYNLEKNCGVSIARNSGVEKAQAEWIAFLDCDDEWLPHKLQTQFTFLRENPEFPLVHSNEIWVRNGVRVNAHKKHAKGGGDQFARSVEVCCISPSTVLMAKNIFEELGGFNPEFPVCEDYDLWLRVTVRFQVGFIADALVVKYGGHADQLSTRFHSMDWFRVLSAKNLLSTWRTELTPPQIQTLEYWLLKRSRVLALGYMKHGKLHEMQRLKQLLAEFKSAYESREVNYE